MVEIFMVPFLPLDPNYCLRPSLSCGMIKDDHCVICSLTDMTSVALLKRIHSSFVVILQIVTVVDWLEICIHNTKFILSNHRPCTDSSHLLSMVDLGRVERRGRQTIASFPGPSPTVSIGEPAQAAAQLCYWGCGWSWLTSFVVML